MLQFEPITEVDNLAAGNTNLSNALNDSHLDGHDQCGLQRAMRHQPSRTVDNAGKSRQRAGKFLPYKSERERASILPFTSSYHNRGLR